jgi:hypothetical protein
VWKTKLLKTCDVDSVIPTAIMKKGFAESSIKKRLGMVKAVSFIRSFKKRIQS